MKGGGQEELPHIRGQGQQPKVPGWEGPGTAKRSYPTYEVEGRSWEDLMPERPQPRGVTPHPRSGAAGDSARLRRHRNSGEEPPHT